MARVVFVDAAQKTIGLSARLGSGLLDHVPACCCRLFIPTDSLLSDHPLQPFKSTPLPLRWAQLWTRQSCPLKKVTLLSSLTFSIRVNIDDPHFADRQGKGLLVQLPEALGVCSIKGMTDAPTPAKKFKVCR